MRIRCRAVLLDAGGVIVLPDRRLVADALARIGFAIAPSAVPAAHYRAVWALDHDPQLSTAPDPYPRALSMALGVPSAQLPLAGRAVAELADRRRAGKVLWSEQTPSAMPTIEALRRAGFAVVIVTNSDGKAARNLRDAGVVADVVDSGVVGMAKPAPEIFRIARERMQVRAADAVHVGDSLSADVAGARAAGIVPIHFDPARRCRERDHRHVRTLSGVWRHVVPGP